MNKSKLIAQLKKCRPCAEETTNPIVTGDQIFTSKEAHSFQKNAYLHFKVMIRNTNYFLTFMAYVNLRIIPTLFMAPKKTITMKVIAVHNEHKIMFGINGMAGIIFRDGQKKKEKISTSQQ